MTLQSITIMELGRRLRKGASPINSSGIMNYRNTFLRWKGLSAEIMPIADIPKAISNCFS
jgi:hypothetical protein